MLTALALIMGAMTAFASPENPTNEEVMTALTRATTVFEWFEHNPLPTDGKERFDSGYMLYYSVSDPTIHNMLDLKAPSMTSLRIPWQASSSAAIRCIARLITNFCGTCRQKSKPSQGYTDLQLEPSVKRPDCCDGKDPGLCR